MIPCHARGDWKFVKTNSYVMAVINLKFNETFIAKKVSSLGKLTNTNTPPFVKEASRPGIDSE